jgi:hypothetical protein
LFFDLREFQVTHRTFFSVIFVAPLFIAVCGFAQSLPDVSSIKDLPSSTPPRPIFQRLSPISLHSKSDSHATSSALATNSAATPFSVANVISAPNFDASFITRGKTWQLRMMGNAPWNGGSTSIPVHILAVSLRLQNANLVTYTTVPVAAFETPTLNSPNFQTANYSTGAGLQFADAVQRAEFFHNMKTSWHTLLRPATIVHSVTLTVPRFTSVSLEGASTQVQTYSTSKSSDGHTVIFLLDQFFNQALFNLVTNEINAGRFSKTALNIALLPNTYLYSLNINGGMGDCCVLGFHTFFSDGALPTESRYIFAFASWVSPGMFSGFQDVTALSHEISESLNDPFINNTVPAWQFPGEPGTCQDNLETGDPVEVLGSPMFTVKTAGVTYHPQTEALLQWFEQKTTSTAINSAFSYPNTKALTHGATPFGPLSCP